MLELPVEASTVEEAGDKGPEQDLREEDVEEDAHTGGMPHLHEHMLPHPVNQCVVGALVVPPVQEPFEDACRRHHVHQHRVHAGPFQGCEWVVQIQDVNLQYVGKFRV